MKRSHSLPSEALFSERTHYTAPVLNKRRKYCIYKRDASEVHTWKCRIPRAAWGRRLEKWNPAPVSEALCSFTVFHQEFVVFVSVFITQLSVVWWLLTFPSSVLCLRHVAKNEASIRVIGTLQQKPGPLSPNPPLPEKETTTLARDQFKRNNNWSFMFAVFYSAFMPSVTV